MSSGEKLRRFGPLLPYVAPAKFAKRYNQPDPEGSILKVWVELVVQSVLGMSRDNQASLVLLSTEQLYSLPEGKDTRLLLCKNRLEVG